MEIAGAEYFDVFIEYTKIVLIGERGAMLLYSPKEAAQLSHRAESTTSSVSLQVTVTSYPFLDILCSGVTVAFTVHIEFSRLTCTYPMALSP